MSPKFTIFGYYNFDKVDIFFKGIIVSLDIFRIGKFAIVGLFVTGVDFVSFWLLLNLFEKFKIKTILKLRNTTIANIIGFAIANSVSFILNTFFTFSDSTTNKGWIPYLLVSLFSLSVSTVLVQILTSDNLYKMINDKIFRDLLAKKHYALVVKLFTVMITMVTNYFGYQLFVYS
ncbi:MAG: GtrA family protein [Patescibacteria group bacterium]